MTAAARDRDEASPLALDLIGANRRMRDTLEMVMRGPARGRYVLADGAQALAVIVNLDGVGAQAEWSRYRALHPERPTIALTLDSQPVPGADAVVSKPVQVDRLVEALDRVRTIVGRPAPVAATSSVSSRPPTPAPQERNRSGTAPAAPAPVTAAPPVQRMAQPVIPGYRATGTRPTPSAAALRMWISTIPSSFAGGSAHRAPPCWSAFEWHCHCRARGCARPRFTCTATRS